MEGSYSVISHSLFRPTLICRLSPNQIIYTVYSFPALADIIAYSLRPSSWKHGSTSSSGNSSLQISQIIPFRRAANIPLLTSMYPHRCITHMLRQLTCTNFEEPSHLQIERNSLLGVRDLLKQQRQVGASSRVEAHDTSSQKSTPTLLIYSILEKFSSSQNVLLSPLLDHFGALTFSTTRVTMPNFMIVFSIKSSYFCPSTSEVLTRHSICSNESNPFKLCAFFTWKVCSLFFTCRNGSYCFRSSASIFPSSWSMQLILWRKMRVEEETTRVRIEEGALEQLYTSCSGSSVQFQYSRSRLMGLVGQLLFHPNNLSSPLPTVGPLQHFFKFKLTLPIQSFLMLLKPALPSYSDDRYQIALLYSKVNEQVLYDMRVTDLALGRSKQITFRFSQAKKFHDELMRNFKKDTGVIPDFPKKNSTAFWNRTNQDRRKIQTRQRQLEFYFTKVFNHPTLRASSYVKNYLAANPCLSRSYSEVNAFGHLMKSQRARSAEGRLIDKPRCA